LVPTKFLKYDKGLLKGEQSYFNSTHVLKRGRKVWALSRFVRRVLLKTWGGDIKKAEPLFWRKRPPHKRQRTKDRKNEKGGGVLKIGGATGDIYIKTRQSQGSTLYGKVFETGDQIFVINTTILIFLAEKNNLISPLL